MKTYRFFQKDYVRNCTRILIESARFLAFGFHIVEISSNPNEDIRIVFVKDLCPDWRESRSKHNLLSNHAMESFWDTKWLCIVLGFLFVFFLFLHTMQDTYVANVRIGDKCRTQLFLWLRASRKKANDA